MSEKERFHEAQPGFNEFVSASEEEKSIKLDTLDSRELIPSELANIPGIVGQVRAVVHRPEKEIDYVVADEQQTTLQHIESGFTYFDREKLEEYPELALPKKKYSRPLAIGTLREISPDILFGSIFETNPEFRGKGAGVVFQEHIAHLAKKLGFKFYAGYQNDADTARFFLKRGRYLLEEIKDELQKEFEIIRDEGGNDRVFYTIQFLDSDDIAKYVKPERIDTDIEDKIDYKEKKLTLDQIFTRLAKGLNRIQNNEDELSDRATLIEVLEDINQLLPEKDRLNVQPLSEDDDNLHASLKTLFEHLKNKSDRVILNATLEQLKVNFVW